MNALYRASVVHTRVRPVRHRLRHRLFQLLLDLDAPPSLRLFGFNRAAPVSFHERDHGDGSATPLAAQVRAQLAAAGLPVSGRILVLCMPRVLGMAFNPLTVFFCHAPEGALQAVLYQVNNTFGQRHAYLIPVTTPGPELRQRCGKGFHVSPFMDMGLEYRFRLRVPDGRLTLAIDAHGPSGPVLFAALAGERRPLTDATLLAALLRFPLQAAAVLLGIHWQALKLWGKGLRLRPRPPAPALPVTHVLPEAHP